MKAHLLFASGEGEERTLEVAHEVLFYTRKWLDEDREFLLWHRRLGGLLTEWVRARESDEALLRGPLLIERKNRFDQRSQGLSDQDRNFLSASREQRERVTREEKERQQRELEAARRIAKVEANHARESEERRKEQLEAGQKLAQEQKRRAELAEKSEKELTGTAIIAAILLAIVIIEWHSGRKSSSFGFY